MATPFERPQAATLELSARAARAPGRARRDRRGDARAAGGLRPRRDRDPPADPVRQHGRHPGARRPLGGAPRDHRALRPLRAGVLRAAAADRLVAALPPAPGPDPAARRRAARARPELPERRRRARQGRALGSLGAVPAGRAASAASGSAPPAPRLHRRAPGDPAPDRGAARLGGRALADLGRRAPPPRASRPPRDGAGDLRRVARRARRLRPHLRGGAGDPAARPRGADRARPQAALAALRGERRRGRHPGADRADDADRAGARRPRARRT